MSEKDTPKDKLPKKFFVRLFVIGGILLVVPLILIISADTVCTGGATFCLSSSTIRIIDAIFPYPMLAGGLLIGYGMKKIADSKQEESEDEEDVPPEQA
ncbi:MAG: hypothetical protein ABSE82_05420 [Nitrososphaerales archaeon]